MRKDRQDEADSGTSQFYGRGKNLNGTQALNLTPRHTTEYQRALRRWLRTNQGVNLVLPGTVNHHTLYVSYYLFSTDTTTRQPCVKECFLTSLQTVTAHRPATKNSTRFSSNSWSIGHFFDSSEQIIPLNVFQQRIMVRK
jgi:hypothetical protein